MSNLANCPAKYSHIQTSNFGDRKKVSEELLRALCANDAYLNAKVKELFDLSDPVSRKRFTPIILDELNSFGVVEGHYNRNPVYQFDNNESNGETYNIAFNMNADDDRYQDDLIDLAKTTAMIDSSHGYALCTTYQQKVVDKSTKCTHRPGHADWAVNAYWYIAYNKSKNYNLKAEWLKNEYMSIPAVCRAQTFKVVKGGYLENITLKLRVKTNTGSPLTVEIRDVVASGKKKGQPVGNKVIARQKLTFKTSGESSQAIKFDKPPYLETGKTYAVVLRSPLSTYSKCFAIGGWGKNCNQDPYSPGSAFLSEDNGYTWIKYGKQEKVAYRDGKNAPVEFAFECHIRQAPETLYHLKDHWIYLKPIHTNPIKKVELYSEANTNGGTIVYQISRDGKNWITLNENNNYTKDWGDNVKYKPYLFVRVKLRPTSNKRNSPTVSHLTIKTTTVAPLSAYARTIFYFPEQSGMLGASIWGELNAPYIISDSEQTSMAIDIVRNFESRVHFKLLDDTVEDLYGIQDSNYVSPGSEALTNYTIEELEREELRKFVGKSYLTEYKYAFPDNISNSEFNQAIRSDADIQEFLCINHSLYASDGTSFIDFLREKGAYIVGSFNLEYASDEQLIDPNTTIPYFKLIQLPDSPAYPLIQVSTLQDTLFDVISQRDAILYLIEVIDDEETADEQMATLDNYSDEQLTSYLQTDTHGLVNHLQENNVYIEGINTDKLSTYGNQIVYSEWLDYDVDYENNTLRFFTDLDDGNDTSEPGTTDDVEVLGNLKSGELIVEYNPLWVKGLTADDMPLKMDLWIEKFVVSEEEYALQSEENVPITFVTKVAPRDNIRQILIWEDTDDEKELIEDSDFTVDYINNIITFNTPLEANTPVTIRYTPNLTDNSLAVAYRMERENVNEQIYIKGNYFSTRT